jgi:2,4-diketo-3-deoxy-L-fuconate hydrolase
MKLLRFGSIGSEKPGLLDAEGKIRDLSAIAEAHQTDRRALVRLQELDARSVAHLPVIPRGVRLGCPISHVGKFIAVGLNYSDHATESGLTVPTEPVLFTKATSCIVGPNDPIVLPRNSVKTDWEVELGVVIGDIARYVTEEEALEYVVGYCLINDISEREYQLERGGTWDKGKGCDTFGPIGPYLVTPDEVGDPQTLDMWLHVNGERKQSGSTRNMIFPVKKLVSYISEFITLNPGDVITTGTPPGVGMAQKPTAVYLRAGDVVTLGISKLGEQRQEVIAWSPPATSSWASLNTRN